MRIVYESAWEHVWGMIPLKVDINPYDWVEVLYMEAIKQREVIFIDGEPYGKGALQVLIEEEMRRFDRAVYDAMDKKALDILDNLKDTPPEYGGFLNDMFWKDDE